MVALIFLFFNLVASLFKAKSRLEAENAALRHQLTVLQGKVRGRVQFTNSDRLFFIQLYRWFPSNPYPRAGIYPASLSRRPLALMRGPQGNLLTVERIVPDQPNTAGRALPSVDCPNILFGLAFQFLWLALQATLTIQSFPSYSIVSASMSSPSSARWISVLSIFIVR